MFSPAIVLITWIPVSAAFFWFFRPVRAGTLAYLIGWLALPVASVPIQGFLDVDKILATNAGVCIGILLFCPQYLRSYRPGAADFLLLVFASGTCMTSLANGLGIYDGLSSFTHTMLHYGVSFIVGRVLVKNQADLLEASRLIVYGAACYALVAVWEWRMSPQVHVALYGHFHHTWSMHYRWGAWRPVVCFPHALGLGIFFAWTSILGLALWRAKQLRSIWGVPVGLIASLPLVGLAASMSFGPWGLFLVGFGVLVSWRGARRSPAWILAAFAVAWMASRYTGATDGQWLTSAIARASADRAASLQYRIDAETLLLNRAKQRPVFGWGGWGRGRARDASGRDLVATDGLWIILLGSYGVVGLCSFYAWWCFPLAVAAYRSPNPMREPAATAVVIVVGLQAVNLLFNGFLSPVLILLGGASVGVILPRVRSIRRRVNRVDGRITVVPT